jgi:hypothetical protein
MERLHNWAIGMAGVMVPAILSRWLLSDGGACIEPPWELGSLRQTQGGSAENLVHACDRPMCRGAVGGIV